MIAAEPQPSHHPGEAALNNPSSGLRAKAFGEQALPVHFLPFGHEQPAFGDRERMDRLHDPAQVLFDPREKCPSVMAVAPNEFHPRKKRSQWRKQGSPSLLVGALSTQHFDGQEIAPAIHQRVTFAAPCFFFPYRSLFPGHEPHWF